MLRGHTVLIPVFLLSCATFASAQGFDLSPFSFDDPFIWDSYLTAETVPPGTQVLVRAEVFIEEGHIVYRDDTHITVEVLSPLRVGPTIYPESVDKEDFEGNLVRAYQGEAVFEVPLWVPGDAEPGRYSVQVNIRSKGCSDILCYFPRKEYALTLVVEGEPVPGATIPELFLVSPTEPTGWGVAGTGTPETAAREWVDRVEGNLLFALFLAFLAGIATSLTPCVYPMIPITVSIFGARETRNRFEAFTLSLTYVAGIAVMYSTLGVVAGSGILGIHFGTLQNNPVVAILLAFFFGALGLSMLGAFSIQIPSSLQSRLSKVSGAGYASAFGMGLVGGIIAAPCTGPALLGMLGVVALLGRPLLGFWLLLFYALGLGMLFLILGTFAGRISSLPRSGRWMESVKSLFGIVLLGMALVYAVPVVRPLGVLLGSGRAQYMLLVGALIVASLGLGSLTLSFHDDSLWARSRKAGGILCGMLSVFLVIGPLLFSPVLEYGAQGKLIPWFSVEEGMQLAERENRYIFLEFRTEGCPACIKLDRTTFSDPRVAKALERFVPITADLTIASLAEQELAHRFHVLAYPVLIVLTPRGEPVPGTRIDGFLEADQLLSILEKVPISPGSNPAS